MLSIPRSGSNWVRYWFEYFSDQCTSERNFLIKKNYWGVDRGENTVATMYKRHSITLDEIKKRNIKKLILIVRDYNESYIRYCVGSDFDTRVLRLNELVRNLQLYNDFSGEKHLMYYEDFVLEPKTHMKKFLDFVGVKSEWSDIDIEAHRLNSINLYMNGGLSGLGTQTRGCPSFTNGVKNLTFHQKQMSSFTKDKLRNWFGNCILIFFISF